MTLVFFFRHGPDLDDLVRFSFFFSINGVKQTENQATCLSTARSWHHYLHKDQGFATGQKRSQVILGITGSNLRFLPESGYFLGLHPLASD